MIGKIFITRHGYDPARGRHIKDPFLGDTPSIGACQPRLRKKLQKGDHLFVISGRAKGLEQFVLGGFEVERKISQLEAYEQFPEQRLHERADGQLAGNVIVDHTGKQHPLDDHTNFENRTEDYIVGSNPIALVSDTEIMRGREETLEALQEILKKSGRRPIDIVGRGGATLNEKQIEGLRYWLARLKDVA